jgi:hypothetical protein
MDPVAKRDQVQVAWCQEKEDEVGYGFLVEPQNQGRAGTTWRPSHEWDWCGGCTESAGFAAVHHKTVEVPWLSHKAKTRRLDGRRRDLGALRDFEAEDARRDRKACVEVKRGAIARHPSDGATTRIPKVPFRGVYLTFM